jgi:hypothetical protein
MQIQIASILNGDRRLRLHLVPAIPSQSPMRQMLADHVDDDRLSLNGCRDDGWEKPAGCSPLRHSVRQPRRPSDHFRGRLACRDTARAAAQCAHALILDKAPVAVLLAVPLAKSSVQKYDGNRLCAECFR